MKRLLPLLPLLLLTLPLAAPRAATAQEPELRIRYGLGLNGLIDTDDGFGLGLRTRLSTPINSDLSAALDLGLTGFVFQGRDEASYVFDPQASLIVTLAPSNGKALYILTGLGLYVPLSDDDRNTDPTIHLGLGQVQRLNDTTIYYEIDPALLIREQNVRLVIPLRLGLIF